MSSKSSVGSFVDFISLFNRSSSIAAVEVSDLFSAFSDAFQDET